MRPVAVGCPQEGPLVQPVGRADDAGATGVNGIAVGIGPEAVVILSARPLLAVLPSAPVGGGVARVRAVIGLQVRKDDPCLDPAAMVAAFARRAGVGAPGPSGFSRERGPMPRPAGGRRALRHPSAGRGDGGAE